MTAASKRGFSLIEVLVALFIIGAIVLVVANIPQVITLVTGSKSESKVREVAAKKIEDLRFSGYDSLANGTQTITDPRLNSLTSLTGVLLIDDCPVEVCLNGELAKKITITFNWLENNEPRSFSITTLIAKGGLK